MYWWQANYLYRRKITITAPSVAVPIYYPVQITTDTAALETASKVRSDRNDWRIGYWNGLTWVDLTRHYIGTASTYFPTQLLLDASASDSNHYIYYGSSSEATSKQATTGDDFNGIYYPKKDANTAGLFHFSEGSGLTANDSSGNNYSGAIGSGVVWGAAGKIGNYLDFHNGNGANYLVAVNSPVYNYGAGTVEFWIYMVDGGDQQILWAGGTNNWRVSVSNYKIFLVIYGTPSDAQTQDINISANTWTHVAFTTDGSSYTKGYKDGVLQFTKSSSFTPRIVPTNLYIGNTSSGDGLRGYLQHIRLSSVPYSSYDYVLPTEPTVSIGTEEYQPAFSGMC